MNIASIGIDLGKTTFHLVALGERKDDTGSTPLVVAANLRHRDVVELLVEHGADRQRQEQPTAQARCPQVIQMAQTHGRSQAAEPLVTERVSLALA
jgi:ankyrin repeat protein